MSKFEKAKKLVSEGKIEEANKLMDEIEAENTAVFKEQPVEALENKSLEKKKPEEVENLTKIEKVTEVKSSSYEEVFAKVLMGRDLSPQDKVVFEEVNNVGYTHQVANSPILVPNTVLEGILGLIGEEHAFYGDIRKMSVPGTVTVRKHKAIKAGDAAVVKEGVEAENEENEFVEVKLSGHEIVKDVEVSFKLEAMSTDDFIEYLQTEIADRIGNELGNLAFNGKGAGDEPTGVLTELKENAADRIIETENVGKIVYTDVTKLRALIKSKFRTGLKFYAASETIWNHLANILDETGRPIFIPNPSTEGVGSLLGVIIAEDDGAGADTILLGNAEKGAIENTNEPLSVASEKTLKGRKTLYQGYMITDFTVTYVEAFAALTVKKQ